MEKNQEKDTREFWQPGNMLYPLPAVLVSCGRPGEKPNALTVAWTGTICSDPAMVYISVRPERFSHSIIKDTGEFVINLTTEKMAKITDLCGVKSGRDIDKFKAYGLTALKSRYVKAPAIGQCPVNIECRVKEIIPLGSHDMFIAEVLGVAVQKEYIDENGRLDLAGTRPLIYSHGEYFIQGRFLGKFGFSVKKKGGSGKK